MRVKNATIEALSIASVQLPLENPVKFKEPGQSSAALGKSNAVDKKRLEQLPDSDATLKSWNRLSEKPLPPIPADLLKSESLQDLQESSLILQNPPLLTESPTESRHDIFANHTYISESPVSTVSRKHSSHHLEPLSEPEGLPIAIQPVELETIFESSTASALGNHLVQSPSTYMTTTMSPHTPPRRHKKASLSITVPTLDNSYSPGTSPVHGSRPPSPSRSHHQVSYSITPSIRKFSLSIPSVFKRHKRSGTAGSALDSEHDADSAYLRYDAETSSLEESSSGGGILAALSRWTLSRNDDDSSRSSSPDKRRTSLDEVPYYSAEMLPRTPTTEDPVYKSLDAMVRTPDEESPSPLGHAATMPRLGGSLSRSLPDKDGIALLEESRNQHARSRSVSIDVREHPIATLPREHRHHHRRHSSHHPIETNSIQRSSKPSKVFTPTGEEQIEGTVNQYDILREIGSGAYGRVALVRHRDTGRYYACKIVSKSRLRKKFRWAGGPSVDASSKSLSRKNAPTDPLDMIKREIAILKKVSNHPNINQLVEVMDDGKEDNLFMVFELCEYGQVMKVSHMDIVRPFTEKLARRYFRDIVLGLEYLHYKKIIHRDIKPENLLLSVDGTVQLADFGISQIFGDDQEDAELWDKNASPAFSPPEAFATHCQMGGKAVDIWALGVTLYCFVHGHCPFQSESILELADMIENHPAEISDALSPTLKDLLEKMLKKNPADRIKLSEIKLHPWVTQNGTDPMMSTEENCSTWEDVTEEEINGALRPATLFRRILDKLRPHRKHSHKSHSLRRPSSPTKSAYMSTEATDLFLSNLVESPTAPTRITSSFGAHHYIHERAASPDRPPMLDNSGSVILLEQASKLALPPLPHGHLKSTSSFGEGVLNQINDVATRYQSLEAFATAAVKSADFKS